VSGTVGGTSLAIASVVWHGHLSPYAVLLGLAGGAALGVSFGWSFQVLRHRENAASPRTWREVILSWTTILVVLIALAVVLIARPRAV
jgi:multisubunit Na+/H+ antiporter MnhB subunit